jgi:hypothetical protein
MKDRKIVERDYSITKHKLFKDSYMVTCEYVVYYVDVDRHFTSQRPISNVCVKRLEGLTGHSGRIVSIASCKTWKDAMKEIEKETRAIYKDLGEWDYKYKRVA